MKTLTLEDIKQAEDILDSVRKQLMLQQHSLTLKLLLSPEFVALAHIIQHRDELDNLERYLTCDLGNEMSCYTYLGQDFSHQKKFLAECIQLLDGSHRVFKFVRLSDQPTGVKDIETVFNLALSLESALFSYKVHLNDTVKCEAWEIEFLLADVRAVISKCESIKRFLLSDNPYTDIGTSVLADLLSQLSQSGKTFAAIKQRQ